MLKRFISPRLITLLFMLSGMLLITLYECKAAKKTKKGWLGVRVQEMTPTLREAMKVGDRTGLLITEVVEDSPADLADLRVEDVIVEFDGKKVEKIREFTRLVRKTNPGTEVKIQIIRDGKEKEVQVKIGKHKMKRLKPYIWGDNHFMVISRGPQLGVRVHELNEDLASYFKVGENQGVLILEVKEDSPAEEADLKAGDVITKIDVEQVSDPEELIDTLNEYEEGDVVTIEYVRKGKTEKAEVELESPLRPGYRFWPQPFPRLRIRRFDRDDCRDVEVIIQELNQQFETIQQAIDEGQYQVAQVNLII